MKSLLCLVLGLTLLAAASAMAYDPYVERYEMDYSPETVQGTVYGNVMTHGDGGGVNGSSGFVFENGIATFLDNEFSSGNQGLLLDNAGALLGHGGSTVDMRVRWLAGCEGNGGQKSMGFAGEPLNGRGLRIDQGSLYYVSSGVVTSGAVNMTEWQDLRVLVQPNGSQAVYLMGATPTKIIEVIEPGGTGVDCAVTVGPGFFLGSWGGSSTTLCSFQLDWVRVAAGEPPIPIPEPSGALALASGLLGMAGFAIRRRRA